MNVYQKFLRGLGVGTEILITIDRRGAPSVTGLLVDTHEDVDDLCILRSDKNEEVCVLIAYEDICGLEIKGLIVK